MNLLKTKVQLRRILREEPGGKIFDDLRTTGKANILDMAAELTEMDKAATMISRRNIKVLQAKVALDQIEKGTYGTCLNCMAEIPEARLEIKPEALFCIDCQDAMDHRELPEFEHLVSHSR